MLAEIAAILMGKGLVNSTWAGEMSLKGDLVRLYREYYDGQHRMKLTNEMRKMMSITDERLDRYNANYCEMVILAMADRLTVDTVEAKEPTPPQPLPTSQARGEGQNTSNPAQEWVNDLLDSNRFDGLQIDVREATLRDGLTFIMAQYDSAKKQTVLAHELAWDGTCGTMVIYDRQGREIVAGVKVWYEGENRRANIYYQNSTAKYVYEKVTIDEGGRPVEQYELNQIETTDDMRDGRLPGVPIVPFYNKNRKGASELVNVIPLQDSLNSTLISAVMNALLTAFAVLFAKGWKPPSGITPGMVFNAAILNQDDSPFWTESKEIAEAAAALNDSYDLIRIQPGEVEPLIKQCDFIISQISGISNTPLPTMMGTDPSGEALKQYDVRLLGKINRAQVQMGNSWENVIALAHTQQTVFGTEQPPASAGWNCRWKNAEIRNDLNILKAAELLQKWGFVREALRIFSQLPGISYSEADIERLMQEQRQDSQVALGDAAGNLPNFGAFNFG